MPHRTPLASARPPTPETHHAPLAEARPLCTFAYLDHADNPQRGTFYCTADAEQVLADPNRLKRAIQGLCVDMGWTFLQVQAVIQRSHTLTPAMLGLSATAKLTRRTLRFSRDF